MCCNYKVETPHARLLDLLKSRYSCRNFSDKLIRNHSVGKNIFRQMIKQYRKNQIIYNITTKLMQR